MNVIKRNGTVEPLQVEKVYKAIEWATRGLNVSARALEGEASLMFFEGIKTSDIQEALIKGGSQLISMNCQDASRATARLVLLKLYKEVSGSIEYPHLSQYIAEGIKQKLLTKEAAKFDLEMLNAAIDPERDLDFEYLGIQTLADRYLLRANGKLIELPQHMFMRVAMGLSLREENCNEKAIEFYNLFSSLAFMSSTPTLFNACTNHAQLSSCYLNKAADTITADKGKHRFASIFGLMEECALLSKYAGGIGTDWTPVRSENDPIIGTNGKSSGIVPYLKVYNDTAVAVNQGGKRKGSFAPYLENWHPDFWDFCELKKNSGEERRRAHDIFPAAWCSDLFMQRVQQGGMWSFFSPADYPELHELFGKEFTARYEQLEKEGKFRSQRPALDVWRKMLGSLFETGHPWITFKDPSNIRNPQQHVGVIHNSNLCTEITLNTSDEETAVCNLGSVNLSRHIKDGQTDYDKLRQTIHTAIRMLDNVIDINFYPSDRAETSNKRHRPIGLGVMGYTEWLVQLGIDWESEQHLDAADELFEHISYYAIEASCALAEELGCYPSYEGSLWSRNIFPIDSYKMLADQRGANFKGNFDSKLDWTELRAKVRQYGMRNSNLMAIAPTATISNIVGTTPCIEAVFERECIKSNMSGDFKWVDPSLRHGKLELCKEVFDIDQKWVIRAAARRQKWIDQAQSLNLCVKSGITGSQLGDLYMLAWEAGLKTTYYLRTQSQGRKAVVDLRSKSVAPEITQEAEPEVMACSISDPNCESCQ